MSLIYKIIYSPLINRILRNLSYCASPILPEKFKIHPSGILKVKIDTGQNIYLKTNQTSYVTKELFWKPSREYEYTAIFSELIKTVDCFFDIGASIGYYSLLAAKINPNGLIYSFEPSAGAYYYLCENIKINKFCNKIIPHPVAISDRIGIAEFSEIYNKKYPGVYNLSGEHNLGTKNILNSKKTEVRSITLNNFVAENNIPKIDLIKIDTEGCEDLILENADKIIIKFQPIIICETLFNKIENRLEAIMKNYGYELYNFVGTRLEKVDTLSRKEDNGVRNCFFIPPQKRNMIIRFLN